MRRRRAGMTSNTIQEEHEMATQRASGLLRRLAQGSLVKQIFSGWYWGFYWHGFLSLRRKRLACWRLFVGALKRSPRSGADASVASIANHQRGQKPIFAILFLYLLGTFSAALAVVSFAFLQRCICPSSARDIVPPSGISQKSCAVC